MPYITNIWRPMLGKNHIDLVEGRRSPLPVYDVTLLISGEQHPGYI